jgi:ABC-type transport system involved in Fe-S cluster assembly, permease component
LPGKIYLKSQLCSHEPKRDFDEPVSSIPEITAFHSDAQLIHEAAIGKIASEQLTN